MTPQIAASPYLEELAAGAWLHNPVTGERARIILGSADTGGRRVESDLWLQPGAAVAGAHVHDLLTERFQVLEGEVGFRVGADERVSRGGERPIVVPAGEVHDWWNAGDTTAHVRVTVEAEPGATGRPAARFVSMIESLWSLGALGRVNAKGMPGPLWLGAIAREYRDVIRFVHPPAVVQAIVFGPLAVLARATGRDPLAPELHGPLAPCATAPHGTAEVEAMLGRPLAASNGGR